MERYAMHFRKSLCVCFILVTLLVGMLVPCTAFAEPQKMGKEVASQAAVLMEADTGAVLYSKNPDEELRPASITKIMTLLLIFDSLSSGKIKLEDTVTVSEHAASLGGSQVYLEPYETQTVETMIKCIAIASANDASVAMAEHIMGSEEAFVAAMNERAKGLSMKHTQFVNCYGLDTDGHYSSAYDVALMSRELITKHPQISSYSTVWIDTIIHTTRKGSSEFGLTNTNKLIRSYTGITGLKTGSTGLAKYCLSATACRNDVKLIAVIMAAPDTKTRFKEAAELLNYGFANCYVYNLDKAELSIEPIKLKGGKKEWLKTEMKNSFSYIFYENYLKEQITFEIKNNEEIKFPIKTGDKIGEIVFFYKGKEIGRVDTTSVENIEEANLLYYFMELLRLF